MVTDLMVDQIEFADLLVLSKTALVAPAEVDRVEAVVRRLNPAARVLRASHGDVPMHELVGARAGWAGCCGPRGSAGWRAGPR